MLPDGWQNTRRVLVIRLDNIGDVIMLSPALRVLRQALPEATLTLMASPAGSQVAPLLPWLDDLMPRRVVWQDVSGRMPLDTSRELALVEEIHARSFDAAVIFTSFSQSPYPPAYICYLAGIPLRLGQSKEFGGSLLTQWVRPLPDEAHQVERNLFLLESAGFQVVDRALELCIPTGIQAAADNLLRASGVDPQEPFILLAPGASCAARRYDPLRFAVVARVLAVKTCLPVVIAGSEQERQLATPIIEASRRQGIVSLVGKTSIPELAGVIRRASLVLCNNSGPLHIADALRRPLVVLYSGTDHESQWRPRSAPARLLRQPTDCSPCYRFNCPYNLECLDIPAGEVVAAAIDLLESHAIDRRPVPSPLAGRRLGGKSKGV
ncbi:MAG: ADP-heptose--LPS heptosyltransferase [Herpetosiphonaceae bacterium]|nr:MAG: ADP-heptose--LPS heptosyltransferase [Herpetosiphonaceae bacterium]